MNSSGEVAIVGAGLTGLTAAGILREHGHKCVVFEKSRGFGGRMATKRRSWGWLDLGAQYFTARNPDFKKMVQQWEDKGVAARWHASMLRYDGSRLEQSPDDTIRYVGMPKMNAMFDEWKTELEGTIYLHTKIKSIKPHGREILLTDYKGGEYGPFGAVLITTPYDQAVDMLTDELMSDQLSPAYRMAPAWGVGLQFEEPVAINNYKNVGGIFVNENRSSWISHNSSKPGRCERDNGDTWIVHFNPEWSRKYLNVNEDWIIEQAMDEMEEISGQHLPQIANTIAHRWKYARNAGKDIPQTSGFLKTGDHHCYLAGDWTLGGRVENAFLSGRAVACEVLKI